MLDVKMLISEKLVINMKLFVIKVAICKQSSILTSIQILTTYCQKATDKKYGSGNLPMSDIL
jgi:hypothetical protein